MPAALEKNSREPNWIVPDRGARRPAIAFNSVDFPVPLRPQRTVRRPDGKTPVHPPRITRPSRSTRRSLTTKSVTPPPHERGPRGGERHGQRRADEHGERKHTNGRRGRVRGREIEIQREP